MTGQEAFKNLTKGNPFVKVRGCLDFGTFFVFSLAPLYVKNTDNYLTGTVMDAVDKQTGRIFKYDITSDIDAYEKATPVKIITWFDRKMK